MIALTLLLYSLLFCSSVLSDGTGDGSSPQNAAYGCGHLFKLGKPSGTYYVRPIGFNNNPFRVYCDNVHDGGAWYLYASGTTLDPQVAEILSPTGSNQVLNDVHRKALESDSVNILRFTSMDMSKKLFLKDPHPYFDNARDNKHIYQSSSSTVECSVDNNNYVKISGFYNVNCSPRSIGTHQCGFLNGWMMWHRGQTYSYGPSHPCFLTNGEELVLVWIKAAIPAEIEPPQNLPRSCKELANQPSGTYLIKPQANEDALRVYCDNDHDDGGWTLIGIGRSFDEEVNQILSPITVTNQILNKENLDKLMLNSNKVFRFTSINFSQKLFVKDQDPYFNVTSNGKHTYMSDSPAVQCSVDNVNYVPTNTFEVNCNPRTIGKHTCGVTAGWMLWHDGQTYSMDGGHPCFVTNDHNLVLLWLKTSPVIESCDDNDFSVLDGDNNVCMHIKDGDCTTTIASLSVQKPLKLAPEDTCNASNKGAIAYSDAEQTVRVCDGTNWKSLVTSQQGIPRNHQFVQAYGSNSDVNQGYVEGRLVTIFKRYANSKLRVTYSDSWRAQRSDSGSPDFACSWTIRVNGLETSPLIRASVYRGSNSNVHRHGTLVGIVNVQGTGGFTFQVYVDSLPQYPNSDCYTGWQDSFYLGVEEIE